MPVLHFYDGTPTPCKVHGLVTIGTSRGFAGIMEGNSEGRIQGLGT